MSDSLGAVDVSFKENGDEYTGWLRLTGNVESVSFNDAMPRGLTINGLRLEIDEDIISVAVGGIERTIAESWQLP